MPHAWKSNGEIAAQLFRDFYFGKLLLLKINSKTERAFIDSPVLTVVPDTR